FSGFSLATKPDHRYWQVFLSNISGTKGIGLVYDNHQAREMSYYVYGLIESFPYWQPVYSYYCDATKKSGVNPYDLEQRSSGIARYYELEGLEGTVELGLDDAELLKGDINFTINVKLPSKELY